MNGIGDVATKVRYFGTRGRLGFEADCGAFRKSRIRPKRPVISVPLSVVWVATPIAGCFLRNKRERIYSCYDKLACDLVFDNGTMMGTGFRPRHSLETILAADKRR